MAMPKNAFADKLRAEADFYRVKGDPDLAWISKVLDQKAELARFHGATSAADLEDRIEALMQADFARIEAERRARADYDDRREAEAAALSAVADDERAEGDWNPYY